MTVHTVRTNESVKVLESKIGMAERYSPVILIIQMSTQWHYSCSEIYGSDCLLWPAWSGDEPVGAYPRYTIVYRTIVTPWIVTFTHPWIHLWYWSPTIVISGISASTNLRWACPLDQSPRQSALLLVVDIHAMLCLCLGIMWTNSTAQLSNRLPYYKPSFII